MNSELEVYGCFYILPMSAASGQFLSVLTGSNGSLTTVANFCSILVFHHVEDKL